MILNGIGMCDSPRVTEFDFIVTIARIERFWRDVNKFTCKFHQTFMELEEDGLLSIDDENSMFILHHVYLPRINQEIEDYRKGWNAHPLSTESYHSPEQLLLIHARQRTEIFDQVCESMCVLVLIYNGSELEFNLYFQANLRNIFTTCMSRHDPLYEADDPIH